MAPVTPGVSSSAPARDPMAPVSHSIGGTTPLPPASAMPPVGHGEPSATVISDQLANARLSARKLAMRRRRAPRVLIASMLLLLIVVGGLGIGYATGVIRFGRDPMLADQVAGVSQVAPAFNNSYEGSKLTGPVVGTPTVHPADSEHGSDQPPRPLPGSEKNTNSAERPPDPAQVARFKAELRIARKALGERQFHRAKERIESAEQLAASEEQTQLVATFKILATHVEGFWDAVREGINGLENAGELQIGKTFVSVVEVGPSHLLIREAGENRRYSVDQLPARLAVAIAQHWFDDRPDNKLHLAAFHFVGPPIDVAEAKRLWEKAGTAGVEVDRLLKLLEM